MTQASSTLGNRRAARRAELHAPVLIDAERAYFTAQCRDVSQVGIGVETQATFSPGMTLDVYFELPCGSAIEARASVARVAPNCVGLRFEHIGAQSAEALREYCDGWRTQLLQNAAVRTTAPANVRIASQASPSAAPVRKPTERALFAVTADDCKSETRVKVARIIPVTGERKA